ncbi:MAG: hypothetical protein JRJ09_14125 [Deltaproteobacteria bacterium]|nr:hypothetical protein [Deltaproteobacteria bacterium]MBW2049647.1 hypothetical protein [Deltaproteobacteria bacterium]MBW2354923.1 hypothetical protein [Deltaproteobacteria bacterium]
MKSLLEIVTRSIDDFSEKEGIVRFGAIIGGEAVILHGVPRTTLDLDILFFAEDQRSRDDSLVKRLAAFLGQAMGEGFEVEEFEASRDPFDPLRHDLIIITDSENRFKKLDILIANYEWELEGLREMDSPSEGPLQVFPIPYLVAMKLMAGGAQDEEDIRNLFLVMTGPEKEKSLELARLIKRDKNLSRVLASGRHGRRTREDGN